MSGVANTQPSHRHPPHPQLRNISMTSRHPHSAYNGLMKFSTATVRWSSLILLGLSIAAPFAASAQLTEVGDGGPGPVKAEHLTAELITLAPQIAAGGQLQVGLVLHPRRALARLLDQRRRLRRAARHQVDAPRRHHRRPAPVPHPAAPAARPAAWTTATKTRSPSPSPSPPPPAPNPAKSTSTPTSPGSSALSMLPRQGPPRHRPQRRPRPRRRPAARRRARLTHHTCCPSRFPPA